MRNAKINIIECDGLQIAASIESSSEAERPIYYSANCLISIERGELQLRIEGQRYTARAGEFLFVRKHTQGTYIKARREDDPPFREHIFALHDPFIKEVIREFTLPADILPTTLPVIKFGADPILRGLMSSLEGYIKGRLRIDRKLIRMKTREALYALTQLDPNLIHVLNEFSQPGATDLVQFMKYSFTQNLSLEQFAKLSGRTLSTFNRHFRRAFQQPPRQWIRQQRLELALQLLHQTDRTISEIYLEVGFSDLAHFSRSFKKYFGQNPSDVVRSPRN